MVTYPQNISLCSGYGGLDLAIRGVFPRTRTICYVERSISAARILAKRMEEGLLDSAPIWSDIKTFDPSNWKCDILAAGFPCQPHSIIGKRKGTDDIRWIWEDITKIIETTKPSLLFLENVRGLLSSSQGGGISLGIV